MKIFVKNTPRITLANVLRRRKTTLNAMLVELGVTTYEGLLTRCDRMGVVPPTRDEFDSVTKKTTVDDLVNSPEEGVVVVGPPPDEENTTPLPTTDAEEESHKSKKKRVKKLSSDDVTKEKTPDE